MRRRLLIADDHEMIIEGVARLLTPEFEVVGEVTNGRALVSEAKRLKPDVVVLDVGMPELNGIEAARQITEAVPAAKLIFLTQQLDAAYVHSAFGAGAKAYVAKQSVSTELLDAVRLASRGGYYVSPLAIAKKPELLRHYDPKINPENLFGGRLTGRQREVLQLIAEGKSAKEIAVALNISVKTVDFHRASISEELGIRSTAELTRYALAKGIVSD